MSVEALALVRPPLPQPTKAWLRHASLLLLTFATTALAAVPAYPGMPRVSGITPFGWHRGATVEVTFRGAKLFHPQGVLCADTDQIAVNKISAIDSDEGKPDQGTRALANISISPTCPCGVHYLRLYTDYGIAEVMPFYVGALTTYQELEPPDKSKLNHTLETAEALPGPATVNGYLLGDDEDLFKIEVKAGQLLSAEIACARLALENDDGTEVILSVRDAAGKTLASCDDTALLLADPYLSIKAPAEGPLYVSVKPLLPSISGKRIPYQLSIGDFLRPAGVYPAGGPPGEAITARLLGLPPDVPDQQTITGPADKASFLYHASAGTPTPNLFRTLAGGNALETEPNDTPNTATVAAGNVPVALNGILEKDGDVDCFKFTASKGQRLVIASYAQALGSPADLQFEVLPVNAKPGQNPDKADDSSAADLDSFEQTFARETLDPSLIFTPKEDGEFILTVRDSRRLGSPLSGYRIEITPATNGVLAGFYSPDNNQRNSRISSQVARGNRALFLMNVRPTHGTDKITGELQVTARNLPAGVTMTASPFTIDQKRVPIMFEAAADAPITATFLELDVQPTDPAAPHLHSAYSHNIGMTYANNEISTAVHFDKLAFAVTDQVPFKISVAQPTLAVSRSGELLLEVELTRLEGFTEPVELNMENVPTGIVPQTGTVIPPESTHATLRIAAEGGAQYGKFPIVVTARNKGSQDERAGKLRASSLPITLEVAEPFLRLKLARASIERGKKSHVKATIERLHALPGTATVKLIRLPKGLEMCGEALPLPADATEISLELTASPDALVGTYPAIACELAITMDGKELKQIAGTGLIRVDPERK